MKKAILGRTGIETGIIGLGLEHLEKAPYEQVASTVEAALEKGVSYIDLFMPTPNIRDHVGKLMKGRRSLFQIQGHMGACLQEDGQYFRTREPAKSERHAEDLLKRLGTDYVDTLMIHFVDEPNEWAEVAAPGGLLEIALRWKKEGRARAIGMSGHKVPAAMEAVRSGVLDVLMFPVNPAFDILPGDVKLESLWEAGPYEGLKESGSNPMNARRDLFLECQRGGVAIVAMKPFAGGWVFWPENPSGIVLTPAQCLQYSLSQPGVVLAVPGCKTPAEVDAALAWLDASDEAKDFGPALLKTDWKLSGRCMYCNHCLPCPAGIDIAAVTKLLDSAGNDGSSEAIRTAYDALTVSASACMECGECETRCPFSVKVRPSMRRAAELFGK